MNKIILELLLIPLLVYLINYIAKTSANFIGSIKNKLDIKFFEEFKEKEFTPVQETLNEINTNMAVTMQSVNDIKDDVKELKSIYFKRQAV